MKKVILTAAIAVIFQLTVLPAFAGGIVFFKGTWEQALAEADKQGKLLFIDAYAEWCGPCKMMDKDVFPDAGVGEFYNANFVSYKIDVDDAKGGEIFAGYGGSAMPTYLFVDGKGDLIHKQLGYMPADQFIEVGKKALKMPEMKSKYSNGGMSEEEKMEYILTQEAPYGSDEFNFFLDNLDTFIANFGPEAFQFYATAFEAEFANVMENGADSAGLMEMVDMIERFGDYLPEGFDVENFKSEVKTQVGQ